MPAGKIHGPDMHIPHKEQREASFQGLLPRLVRIEQDGNLRRVPIQQVNLFSCQRCPQCGNNMRNARIPQLQQIKVSLDKDGITLTADFLPRPVQTI